MFTCNVLCYGDSNTWGNIPNNFDPQSDLFQRYEREKRWTGVLQTALGSGFHVIEAAINGRTTDLDEITPGRPYRNGLSLLPLCLESNCPLDIIIFMLGTNDAQIQYNRSAKDIVEGMRGLIKVAKESNKGRRGLDRETHKELLLKHIVAHMQTGSRLQELMQVLPMLSKDQVQTLIKALKHQGAIFNQGTTRSALWYPTVIASQ